MAPSIQCSGHANSTATIAAIIDIYIAAELASAKVLLATELALLTAANTYGNLISALNSCVVNATAQKIKCCVNIALAQLINTPPMTAAVTLYQTTYVSNANIALTALIAQLPTFATAINLCIGISKDPDVIIGCIIKYTCLPIFQS